MKRKRNPEVEQTPQGNWFPSPDLEILRGAVSEKVFAAMLTASAHLTKIGIRHALAGGLAVGAYGHVRATKDVDFLLGDEGFVHHAHGIVSVASGVPSRVADIPIDSLSALPDERHLDEALDRSISSFRVPILPIEALVYMKLKSPRPKDALDVIELIQIGHSAEKINVYLEKYAPDLSKKFLAMIATLK